MAAGNQSEPLTPVRFIRDTRPEESNSIISKGTVKQLPQASVDRWMRRKAIELIDGDSSQVSDEEQASEEQGVSQAATAEKRRGSRRKAKAASQPEDNGDSDSES